MPKRSSSERTDDSPRRARARGLARCGRRLGLQRPVRFRQRAARRWRAAHHHRRGWTGRGLFDERRSCRHTAARCSRRVRRVGLPLLRMLQQKLWFQLRRYRGRRHVRRTSPSMRRHRRLPGGTGVLRRRRGSQSSALHERRMRRQSPPSARSLRARGTLQRGLRHAVQSRSTESLRAMHRLVARRAAARLSSMRCDAVAATPAGGCIFFRGSAQQALPSRKAVRACRRFCSASSEFARSDFNNPPTTFDVESFSRVCLILQHSRYFRV